MPILRIINGPRAGLKLDLGERTVIGRDETDSGLQILDKGVSRRHAEIVRSDGHLIVRDLRSRNGTLLNGHPIIEQILKEGDMLQIGNTTCVLQCSEPVRENGATQISDAEITCNLSEELTDARIQELAIEDTLGSVQQLRRASRMAKTDPDMALAKCRQMLEKLIHDLYRKAVKKDTQQNLKTMIHLLSRRGVLPRKIQALAFVVRELGNIGAHPIYDDEELSHREAHLCLNALLIILNWKARQPDGGPELSQDTQEVASPSPSDILELAGPEIDRELDA